MAALIVIDGPAEGQKFALEQHGLVMVGRDHSCTFQILDPQMSRMHFQIKLDAKTESHSAVDFDSANGVSVNGKRIEEATPLNDGDVIRSGNTSVVYSVEDAPDAQTITQLLRKHYQGRFDTELQ
jgi:pSer/pThr/pTyr-binding forkhead associated (FHA) protein